MRLITVEEVLLLPGRQQVHAGRHGRRRVADPQDRSRSSSPSSTPRCSGRSTAARSSTSTRSRPSIASGNGTLELRLKQRKQTARGERALCPPLQADVAARGALSHAGAHRGRRAGRRRPAPSPTRTTLGPASGSSITGSHIAARRRRDGAAGADHPAARRSSAAARRPSRSCSPRIRPPTSTASTRRSASATSTTPGFSGASLRGFGSRGDAGPAERPPRRQLRLQRRLRHRRRPARHPAGGDRARRSPEGRRLGDLRQRRDRRRHQLHPAAGLPRRRASASSAACSEAGGGAQRAADAGAGHRRHGARTASTSSRSSITGSTAAWRRRARSFAATAYRPELGLDRTSRRAFPANIPARQRSLRQPGGPGLHGTHRLQEGRLLLRLRTTVRPLPPPTTCRADARHAGAVGRARGLSPSCCGRAAHAARYRSRRRRSAASPRSATSSWSCPEGSPYYPAGLGLSGDIVGPFYRTVPLGPRVTDVERDTPARAPRLARAAWPAGTYDAALLHRPATRGTDYVSGYVDTVTVADAFATGLVNPFGDSGPAGNALLAAPRSAAVARSARGTTRSVDLRASRVARWSAGGHARPRRSAARRAARRSTTDRPINAHRAGNSYQPAEERRAQTGAGVYAELALPLLRDARRAARAARRPLQRFRHEHQSEGWRCAGSRRKRCCSARLGRHRAFARRRCPSCTPPRTTTLVEVAMASATRSVAP